MNAPKCVACSARSVSTNSAPATRASAAPATLRTMRCSIATSDTPNARALAVRVSMSGAGWFASCRARSANRPSPRSSSPHRARRLAARTRTRRDRLRPARDLTPVATSRPCRRLRARAALARWAQRPCVRERSNRTPPTGQTPTSRLPIATTRLRPCAASAQRGTSGAADRSNRWLTGARLPRRARARSPFRNSRRAQLSDHER